MILPYLTRSHWMQAQLRSLNYRIECRLAFTVIGVLMLAIEGRRSVGSVLNSVAKRDGRPFV